MHKTAVLLSAAILVAAAAPMSKAGSQFAREMNAATDRMMDAMHVQFTGDVDRDFAAVMIPHHQGAIDMAQVELKYGKDPELRAMAEQIIKAQEEEIATLKKWQQEKGM